MKQMEPEDYAAWYLLSRHIPGVKRRSIINAILRRGAMSPDEPYILISQREADQLKREQGFAVTHLGGMSLKVR